MAIVVLSTVTVRVTGARGSHWQEKTKQCHEIHNKRSLGYDSVVEPLPRTHQVPGSTPTLKWRVRELNAEVLVSRYRGSGMVVHTFTPSTLET